MAKFCPIWSSLLLLQQRTWPIETTETYWSISVIETTPEAYFFKLKLLPYIFVKAWPVITRKKVIVFSNIAKLLIMILLKLLLQFKGSASGKLNFSGTKIANYEEIQTLKTF